jgi:hypothetical protein
MKGGPTRSVVALIAVCRQQKLGPEREDGASLLQLSARAGRRAASGRCWRPA